VREQRGTSTAAELTGVHHALQQHVHQLRHAARAQQVERVGEGDEDEVREVEAAEERLLAGAVALAARGLRRRDVVVARQ
jgi:hypothetical protein